MQDAAVVEVPAEVEDAGVVGGADGVDEAGVVEPPVGGFGTQAPFFCSSPSLQGTGVVDEIGVVDVTGVVDEAGTVEPPVGGLGTQTPFFDSSFSLHGDGVVVTTGVVEPPVGGLGIQTPSFCSSLSLHGTEVVLVTDVVDGGVVDPPVGGLGTHELSFCSSFSLQAGGVTTGTGVVAPPVGVFGTHDPLLNDSMSLQDVVAAGVDVAGGVTPPVGVFGTHLPSFSSSLSLHVGGVGPGGAIVDGGVSPHTGQKVAVEVIVVVERVILMDVMLPLVTVTGHVVKVVTTISVVTRSDDAGVVVLRLAIELFGTQPVPEKVCSGPHVGPEGLTSVVRGTHFPPIEVSEVAHVVDVVVLPVDVFGTQEPLSRLSVSLQDTVVVAGVVVAGVVDAGVVDVGVVDAGVVDAGVVVAGVVFGTQEPLSF